MGSSTDSNKHDGAWAEPDILGQFPILNTFSVLAYGFELPLDVDRHAVFSALETAFDKLIEQIPFLGSQIVVSDTGARQIAPWPEDVPRHLVAMKVCDDSIVPMSQLLAEKAPVQRLDGKVLCPWPALPFPHGITGPVPVVHLQASFVRGGLILNLSTHHTMMDGTADFQFLKLLALVLNGHEVPAEDLEQANRPRDRVVPLIPEGEPVKDYSHLYPPPGWKLVMPTSMPLWCYFLLPEDRFAALAETVRASAPPPADPKQRLSKDDILCAFYWKRLCALRLARGMAPDTGCKISRAINARPALGLPPSYLGAQVCPSILRLTLGAVDAMPTAELAALLRAKVVEDAAPWAVRSFATTVAREAPAARARMMYTGTHDVNTDIGYTNVSRALVPKGAWGPLGECKWYRRPNASPIPGSFRIQEAEGGAHPLCLCLLEPDLKDLKEDDEWNKLTICVG
jgi:hypothetical protein